MLSQFTHFAKKLWTRLSHAANYLFRRLLDPAQSHLAVSVAHWVQNWKQTLQIVQPDTLLRWHREGFRLHWKFKARCQKKSSQLGADKITLIQRLARENHLRGLNGSVANC